MDTQQQNRFSTLTHGGVSFKDEKPLMISEVKMILQRKIENARQADAEMLLSPVTLKFHDYTSKFGVYAPDTNEQIRRTLIPKYTGEIARLSEHEVVALIDLAPNNARTARLLVPSIVSGMIDGVSAPKISDDDLETLVKEILALRGV